jgi:carboxyl-terminal processing protease
MPRRNLWIILLTVVVCYLCYNRADHTPYVRHLARAYREINRLALEDPPDRRLFDAAMEGMVAELRRLGDEHSDYITIADVAEFNAEISQEFGGIGVVISLRGKEPPRELLIVSPPEPGRPAANHDIRARDRIIAIDGVAVATMDTANTHEILRRMRGPVGKPVRLTVIHSGETDPVDMEIVRDRIEVDSIHGIRKKKDAAWQFTLDDHPQIGYVRLTTFGERTPEELYEVLYGLVNEGVRGVILDLRDNAGGELQGTVEICNMFLPAGKTIVQTRNRRGQIEEVFRATSETPFQDLPLAILINRYSASASEIVAACMQDHRRAAIIGERSFGKGTVQRLMNVGPPTWQKQDEEYQSGLLKLTASSYWRPSGKNIHRMPDDTDDSEWGVSPNAGMEVQLDDRQREALYVDLGRRELYDPNGDALADDLAETSPEVRALLPFEDEAIAKAVAYLKAQ